MEIYIPLWYLLISLQTQFFSHIRYLHSTMVSINQTPRENHIYIKRHLHSTMVSINRINTTNYYYFLITIYIPLWYLLIACICRDRHFSGHHLHSTMVSINLSPFVVYESTFYFIYIPLWYLLIRNPA